MIPDYEKIVDKLKRTKPLNSFSNVDLMRRFEPQVSELINAINKNTAFSVTVELINRLLDSESVSKDEASQEALALFKKIRGYQCDEVQCGSWHEITQDQIQRFASATGDYQWIHIDQNRVKRESPFRSTIAHGFLMVSLLPTLKNFGNAEMFCGTRLVINYGLDDLRFESPVKPGQSIRATSVIKNVLLRKRYVEVIESIIVEIKGSNKIAFKTSVILRAYP